MPPTYANDEDRIKRNVTVSETGCWVWRLSTDHKGYGMITAGQKRRLAHRFSYETFVGAIPQGLQLDHLCRTRHCVNPGHLEPVTGRENIRRSPIHHSLTNAAKSHCPRGHEYTAENTVMEGPNRSKRRCLTCRRAQQSASKQRRAMQAARVQRAT